MKTFSLNLGLIRRICILLIMINFCSCASGNNANKQVSKTKKDTNSELRLRQEVVNYARYFLDKPYKKGGRDERGFDCSGFVCYVLNHVKIEMEASSQDQSKEGKEIAINQVKPGDLIYFGDTKRIHHVGIITEHWKDALMVIHSTSNRGVIEENVLKSDYWVKRIKIIKELNSYKSNKLAANPVF